VLTLRRGDETVDSNVRLRPLGFEKSEELEIIYDVVPNDGTYLRCLVTHPIVGTVYPAVLFIQGLGCNSIEEPVADPSTTLDLLHQLTLRGFATMRVEKSGVGDSQGEPCFEIGFDEEVRGFVNALRKLRTYDFVDTSNVYVFGHGMGGTMAPLVAREEPVRGVIVYGTAVTPWPEYLENNRLRQAEFVGTDVAEIEEHVRDETRFQRLLLEEGLSIETIVERHPELGDVARSQYPDGAHSFTRSVRFFRELTATDVLAAWSRLDVPVLAMHGEFDYATTDEEHERIAAAVNATHPGNGAWKQIPKAFNAFNERHSLEEALTDPWAGPLSLSVVDETIHFMRENLRPLDASASANE
jgi:pimeloyl-ACP methyl ester carboxylesterase